MPQFGQASNINHGQPADLNKYVVTQARQRLEAAKKHPETNVEIPVLEGILIEQPDGWALRIGSCNWHCLSLGTALPACVSTDCIARWGACHLRHVDFLSCHILV